MGLDDGCPQRRWRIAHHWRQKTTVPPAVPVAVFIATPAQEPDDFDSAMHLFDRLNVEVEHDAKLIADRAEGLLVGHN